MLNYDVSKINFNLDETFCVHLLLSIINGTTHQLRGMDFFCVHVVVSATVRVNLGNTLLDHLKCCLVSC